MIRNSEKVRDIILFGMVYLLFYALGYSSIYQELKGIILFYVLLAILSLPSFLIVITLNYYSSKRKTEIDRIYNLTISIITFMISFSIFKMLPEDPKNIYPVFEEPVYIIFGLCVIAHLSAWGFLELKKMLK